VSDFDVEIPKDCLHVAVIVKSLEYLFVVIIEGVIYLTVFNGTWKFTMSKLHHLPWKIKYHIPLLTNHLIIQESCLLNIKLC
jgi:hypothetical protein